MLKNYIRISIRHIRRHTGYALMNIVGLAVGLAAFVIAFLFVQHELSFENDILRANDTYRTNLDAQVMGQAMLSTSSPSPLARTLKDEVSEVEKASRLDDFGTTLVDAGERRFYESQFFMADPDLFDIFDIELLAGNTKTAIEEPNTVVITEAIARKYFSTADVIGKRLKVNTRYDLEITGILPPPRSNSHFRPDMIGSFASRSDANSTVWLNNSYSTYLRLAPGTDPLRVESSLVDLIRKYVGPEVEQFMGQSFDDALAAGLRYRMILESVPSIYLHSKADDQIDSIGNIQYVYILAIIGLFVLLIACINFMNLTTARATSRAREVGIRKVMGSGRIQLIRQFLGETVILALLSLVIAMAIVALVLPAFNSIAGTSIEVQWWIAPVILLSAVVTGLLAGIYPAFVLSGFRPAVVLKSASGTGARHSWLRSSLVVFQFSISIALLVGTGVVSRQLNFLKNQDLGFEEEQVVVLPIRTKAGDEGYETFRQDLLGNQGIVTVAAGGLIPGPDHIHNNTAFSWEGSEPGQYVLAGTGNISPDYVKTLGMEVVAGRSFSYDHPADTEGWMINESAASKMGFSAEEAVGKTITRSQANEDGSDHVGPIIGVVRDAHFESFRVSTRPLVFAGRQDYRYIPVRIRPERTSETLAFLKERWSQLEPEFAFRYFFLDEEFQQFYEQEQRLGTIARAFTGLAILIACLGLFGLASFVTAQRTREIGVRKVLGASVPGIVALLSREFILLVLLSCVVAFPAAWFVMKEWLQGFAYATDIGVAVFVYAGVSAVLIAWLTVAWQSIRAALSNPIVALRYE